MATVVTGGAGFIGSNLVAELVKQGREVLVVDNLSRGSPDNLRGLDTKLVVTDLRNAEQARGILFNLHVDTIFHLAATIGSETYLHNGLEHEINALLDNVAIDCNVAMARLLWLFDWGVSTIVYASSSAVYPVEIQHRPDAVLRENDCTGLGTEGGYGQAKWLGEQLLLKLPRTRKGIARIFNAYGEKSATNPLSRHVTTAFLHEATDAHGGSIVVHGSGEQTRDFVYVSDCVEALLALEREATEEGVICNIGSGVPTSIDYLAREVSEVVGGNPAIVHSLRQGLPSSPVSRTADVRLAKELLGWEPKVPLREGLERTRDWLKEKVEVK